MILKSIVSGSVDSKELILLFTQCTLQPLHNGQHPVLLFHLQSPVDDLHANGKPCIASASYNLYAP